jgi:two-component system nitrogen regulation response regulator NtrX
VNRTDTSSCPIARASISAADLRLPLVLRGRSAAAARQLREVRQAENARAAVLITAEPGLDELEVARKLHGATAGAFVTVPCSDAPPRLEALLFGVRESSNGRTHDLDVVRRSAALASAATILLLEVGELPASLQRRLARVLRDGEVYVRECRHAMPLAVRIIATAGPQIEDEVHAGRVRADLYRRLSARRIVLAPLRERSEDIPELVLALAEEIAGAHQSAPRTYAPAALTALASLPWPHNLDGLRELLTRLHRIAPGLPARQEDVLRSVGFGAVSSRAARFDKLRDARQRFEREYIAAVLDQHGWRMAQAAATLGIERANLYRKIRQLGLTRPAGGTS